MTPSLIPLDDAHLSELARLVVGWSRPVLLTHARPDGDALGSLVALRRLLRGQGADPLALLYEPPPRRYQWLTADEPLPLWSPDHPQLGLADAVIIVDTCTLTQLEPVADWLTASGLPKLVIDHHLTRDPIADHYLVDERAAAACQIIADWTRAADWAMDEPTALALYVGLATDTGWFRFSNTDARALAMAAHLVRCGVKPADVFERVYQNETVARVRLLAAALGSLELYDNERLAVMTITQQTLADTAAEPSDTEDVINYPLQIYDVQASVLLVEADDQVIRASFRSKPPGNGRPDINVAAVAVSFGGGGHRRASGARIPGTLAEVKARVLKQLT